MAIDATSPTEAGKASRPGSGPLSEKEVLKRAFEWLKQFHPSRYSLARQERYPNSSERCDLLLPGEWVIEAKILRPFGDNEKEAEHWSEQLLHPYKGNKSALGDCLKLLDSGFHENKSVLILGYEHLEPKIQVDLVLQCFELIADKVFGIEIGPRIGRRFAPLVHPCHQSGFVYMWHVSGATNTLPARANRLKASGIGL